MAQYPFNYRSLDDLLSAADKLGVSIPCSEDLSPLARTPKLPGSDITLANSLIVHPMEGFDADFDGSPTDLTTRRYERFAKGGASMAWSEAIAVCHEGQSSAHQLRITKENLDSFKRLVDRYHTLSGGKPFIAQLTHSGRFSAPEGTLHPLVLYKNPLFDATKFHDHDEIPLVDDAYLDTLPELYAEQAALAVEAGFDGIDVKACHKYLLGETLAAFDREGPYGGSYENRTKLFRTIIADTAREFGNKVFLASRFNLYDAMEYPYGFGCRRDDPMIPDFTEIDRLVGEMKALGIGCINITMGTPYLTPHINRPHTLGGEIPEDPLIGAARMIRWTGELQKHFPDIAVVGAGYSFFREYAPYVAAGAIRDGLTTLVGFGRMAFAYPDFAKDMIAGQFDRKRTCVTCSKCTDIMRSHHTTGCPLRDQEIYLPLYREFCMKK
ncbi:MAG: flavin oxidoreductase/NADH oxidase [Clostridia bacterium]|nr:flavin oxidoreductase/NADH oxidase [Clostridia bacterium]